MKTFNDYLTEATPSTFIGVIVGGDRSRTPQITQIHLDVPLKNLKNKPDGFMEFIEDETGLDLYANNDKDTRRMMDAILKSKEFVERNADGDGFVGTSPDKNKLKKALKDFRD